MDKKHTQIIKGIAILLMIYYHLFGDIDVVESCRNFIYIKRTPLTYIICKFTYPVPFFLIVGGYGIYKVSEKGDKHRWSRVLKLMIHYWITLAAFVTIGHFIFPEKYPGSIMKVIENATGYAVTYNHVMWFMLPYIILSVSAPIMFKLVKRIRGRYVVLIALFIHLCTSYYISRYGSSFLFGNRWAYNPLLAFHLMFNFFLGAMAARGRFFERVKEKFGGKKYTVILAIGGMLVLFLINCNFKYNLFYAFGFIMCLLLIPLPRIVNAVLVKLGDQSMNMWMIHGWFCYYLFQDFVYSFRYPVVIFMVLTVISYYISIILNYIAKPIERVLLSHAEIKAKPIL